MAETATNGAATRTNNSSSGAGGLVRVASAGALLAVAGCAVDVDAPAIDHRELELQEAGAVLGFERDGAWLTETASLRQTSLRDEGEQALLLDAPERATLFSAPFEFRKTPTGLSFAVRAGNAASSQLEVTAHLECENRGRDAVRARVGSASVRGVRTDAFSHAEIAVPGALQLELAGGCERLSLQLEVAAGGIYVFDRLGLRAATPAVDRIADSLCGLPENEPLITHARELPEGFMDYEAWMADPRVQAELIELEAALQPFGAEALEPVFDHAQQQVVIPVDAAALSADSVQEALEAAELALPLRVQTACHPLSTVRAAEDTVLERNWHPDADEVTFGSYVDSERAQVVVVFDRAALTGAGADSQPDAAAGAAPANALVGGTDAVAVQPEPSLRDVARALQERLGALVRIEWGSPRRHSRLSDAQPHYGAAAIGSRVRMFCTSGFIVYRNGVRSSVTAGHCFNNGDSVFSGSNAYGLAAGQAPFPQYDMMRIEAAGQRFARSIWTDRGTPTSRVQIHKIDAPVGALVCTSGKDVRAICNIRVVSNTARLCDDDGCTRNLARGTKTGVVLNTEGDSGAPMYSPNGASGATILGMAIGVNNDVGDVVWHKQSQIEAQLNVTVALN